MAFEMEDLAEDLRLAVRLGEYTETGALALIALIGDLTPTAARRIWRRADPTTQGNVWKRHPDGTMEPRYGTARRIWEHTEGPLQGEPIMPALFARWGESVFHHANR
ncbi:hypothetical protein SAMN05421505_120130 [Sinosporangium album]|uniref:Uncharacterized protein n=1 Tax=Sinosporangium album TaxID=504805 RepID=A0A1G8EJJ0_9ACTN|nr:hypothetical protein [Sinosporangium album]SDH70104.1 hypothetical protein SAMN05421505_120130 [Sinosporangium album]